ncbi:uncharacterized protein EI97DRAFT_436238 [Westerdykella ornata]|uniref:Cap binding protein n=1 Tax=Westerdykella ornata TaxID=318751 RepID=A0A6A6JAI9_WESOR|nr:uncharacterized protein EI97DRAFT_436238 [Westerdykella ornata]KAF2273183.1 hypothetical protein EI97DRAFT_436238 [Westerdykella ornata]
MGYGNRKRRYSGDNDTDDRRFRRRFEDRRVEETPLTRLRRQLLHIGSGRDAYEDAVDLALGLDENFDDTYLQNEFFNIMIQLILEQPFRIPYLALVVIYTNSVNTDIATDALKRIATRTQDALSKGNWAEFKLLLRFLACVQSEFEGDGVFSFLEQLFDTVVDLQSSNENDVVGIELVKVILLTIPYAIFSSGASFHEHAQKLLDKTGIVAGNMLPMEGLIHTYAPNGGDNIPMAYHSVIGLLQSQLIKESAAGWPLSFFRPFIPFPEEHVKVAHLKHPFPAFAIPSPVNPGLKPLFPEAYFSLYTGQDIESVPKLDDIAASLIRDSIVDTIDQLDFNREAVAKFLIDLDQFWVKDKFAHRGTSFEKFKERIKAGEELWKPEDIIVEAIFSQLLKLPNPEHKLVYYHSLITECCKIAPSAIAPSLGRAIRTIYKNLDIMDLELAYRFLDWFAHHVSNFDFRWRWQEWADDLSLTELHPQKAFIIAALDREIRLSFAKRIRSTIPENMHSLIPERLDEDKSPDFKYDNEATPYAAEGQALLALLKKKGSNEDFKQTLDKIRELAAEQGIADVLVPSADAFMTAICRAGAKSLSHVLSCIERGKEQLLSIANNSETARRQIVASVVEYWKDQPGVAVRIIDILLNYTILAPMTVVQWALGDYLGAGEALAKAWVFEMVLNTMAKVTKRNRQIALARLQKDLPEDQIELVEATLAKDRDKARELFRYIEDTLRGVAEGGDTLLEKEASGAISTREGELIRAWARRWHTVFVRKAQVEESVVGEEAVEARVRILEAEPKSPHPMPKVEQMDEDAKPGEETNGADVTL